jgi:histidyl-tRNA synthetase
MEFADKSLKAQMKKADKVNADYVIIVGDEELEKKSVILKNMKTKEQDAISVDAIVNTLIGKLK